MLSLRTGPSLTEELRGLARQEEWFRYAVAAKALGGSAWDLFNMREPDRFFWRERGLMMNNAEARAIREDDLDKTMGG